MMNHLRLLMLSFALMTTGHAALAQAPRPAPPAADPQPIALEFDRIEIQRVAQSLTERTHKSVLLDGSVKGSLPVTASGSARTMEEALEKLTGPLGLTWKKVYVLKSSKAASGERIAQLVRTVSGFASPGLVVEDPKSHLVTLYLRDLPAAPDLESQIRTAWPFLEPVYLLSDPKAVEKKPEQPEKPKTASPEHFAEMERQRMDMFLKMSPDDRAKAMQQAMSMVLQTDPAAMQEMMRSGMQAWMQTMQQMTPEQRQQFAAMSVQMMQTIPPETWQNLFQMFRPAPGAVPNR
jgi:hypothetical protein